MLSERLSVKLTVGEGQRGVHLLHAATVSCLTKGVLLLRETIRLLVVMVDGTPSVMGQRFVWCIQVDEHGPQGGLFLFCTQLDCHQPVCSTLPSACPLDSANQPVRLTLPSTCPLDSAINLSTRLGHQLVHLTLPSTCPAVLCYHHCHHTAPDSCTSPHFLALH